MNLNEQKTLLLRVVTQLIEKQLNEQGLRTFGAVLGSGREVQLLVPETIKRQHPSLDELDSYWLEQLRKAVMGTDANAACYCAEVQTIREDGTPITPGIVLFLEQKAGNAEYRFYTYEKNDHSTRLVEQNSQNAPMRLFLDSAPTRKHWWNS
jgi:hypothetical protein